MPGKSAISSLKRALMVTISPSLAALTLLSAFWGLMDLVMVWVSATVGAILFTTIIVAPKLGVGVITVSSEFVPVARAKV